MESHLRAYDSELRLLLGKGTLAARRNFYPKPADPYPDIGRPAKPLTAFAVNGNAMTPRLVLDYDGTLSASRDAGGLTDRRARYGTGSAGGAAASIPIDIASSAFVFPIPNPPDKFTHARRAAAGQLLIGLLHDKDPIRRPFRGHVRL